MAVTMAIEVTTASIVMTVSILNSVLGHGNDRPFLSSYPTATTSTSQYCSIHLQNWPDVSSPAQINSLLDQSLIQSLKVRLARSGVKQKVVLAQEAMQHQPLNRASGVRSMKALCDPDLSAKASSSPLAVQHSRNWTGHFMCSPIYFRLGWLFNIRGIHFVQSLI